MLEWASTVLRLPPAQLLAKWQKLRILEARGDIAAQFANYEKGWPRLRSLSTRFLQLAKQQLQDNIKTVGPVIAQFANVTGDTLQWYQQISQLVGIIDRKQLRNSDVRAKQLDTLLIPAYDLPGRICGFVLLHLARNEPPAISYRRAATLAKIKWSPDCAGLLFSAYSVLEEDAFNNTRFVQPDIVEAVRFQLAWLRHAEMPLSMVAPIVFATYRTRTAWQYLPRRRTVVLGSVKTAVSVAAAADGYITATDYLSESRLWRLQARLQTWNEAAKPWYGQLVQYLSKLPKNQQGHALDLLQLPQAARARFLHAAPIELRETITGLPPLTALRVFKFEGVFIKENIHGWAVRYNNHQITNAVIRIDRIIQSEKGTMLEGRAMFSSATYPLNLKVTAFCSFERLFTIIRKYLQQKYFVEFKYAKKWAARAYALTVAASEPVIIHRESTYGWRPASGSFNFQRFSITQDGDVIRYTDAVPKRRRRGQYTSPTAGMPYPLEVFPTPLLECLQSDRRTAYGLWLLTLGVLGNVLAPVYGRSPICAAIGQLDTDKSAIAACGMVGMAVLPLALCMGCDRTAQSNSRIDSPHAWPYILSQARSHMTRIDCLRAKDLRNVVTTATAAEAHAGAITRGWWHIPQAMTTEYDKAADTAELIVQSVLQYGLRNRVLNPLDNGDLHSLTCKVLRGWAVHNGADVAALDNALAWQRKTTSPEHVLIAHMYSCGQDTIIERMVPGKISNASKYHVHYRDNLVFVSRSLLTAYPRLQDAMQQLKTPPTAEKYTDIPEAYYIVPQGRWAQAICDINEGYG